MPPVVTTGSDENVVRVEVGKEAVAFERTPGAIFEIGDCGRFTIVTGEELDIFMGLGREYFELIHKRKDGIVERLQLDEKLFVELAMEGAFSIGSRRFYLIPADFFAPVSPEVKPGQGGTPPWAE